MKDHQWYAEFDWEDMRNLRADPPYKPNVRSRKDLANFHARESDAPKPVAYSDNGTGWDADFEM